MVVGSLAPTTAVRTIRAPRNNRRRILSLVVIAAAIIAWEVVARTGLLSAALLPPASEVLVALWRLLPQSGFWGSVGLTVGGAMIGLAISAVIAIPIGLMAGLIPFVERSTRMLVDLGRSFPSIALLPVIVLVHGTSITSKVIAVVLACSFPLIVQSLYGARGIDPAIVETSRAYRVRAPLYFLRVALPTATPSIMTGLRLAATMAVLVSVGSEVVGSIPGIGFGLATAQVDGATSTAFAYFIVAGTLGYVVTRSAETLEGHFLRWRQNTDD
ncbi:ABC transporter permease [Microbacterium oryzae]|uniref:ABC transporter permease n=1 Tax=Microbacterium oryzae TaxID=743009 RepID=UPI0025B198A5|nr:ABC transporter permease [Microbacterium oryzae]MDN3310207.1 ABC transporter permease [Microbacterium oryzae]